MIGARLLGKIINELKRIQEKLQNVLQKKGRISSHRRFADRVMLYSCCKSNAGK